MFVIVVHDGWGKRYATSPGYAFQKDDAKVFASRKAAEHFAFCRELDQCPDVRYSIQAIEAVA